MKTKLKTIDEVCENPPGTFDAFVKKEQEVERKSRIVSRPLAAIEIRTIDISESSKLGISDGLKYGKAAAYRK